MVSLWFDNWLAYSDESLGYCVAELRVIMQPVMGDQSIRIPGTDSFLAYVQRFDVVPQLNLRFGTRPRPCPETNTSCYVVKRAFRSNNSRMGDIVQLSQVRKLVDLIPCFGKEANNRLTSETSRQDTNEFWLNKYFNKEVFFHLDH
jgi:hypothetical protein